VALSIQPAETVVTRPDATVELLVDEPSIAVAAARFTPGAAPIPPPHAAAEHTEVFLVLDGALHFRVGEDELVAGTDTVVVVPQGVVYTLRTESEARFVDLYAPSSGHGAFLRALSAEEVEREDARASGTFDQQPAADGAHPSSVVIARMRGIDGEAITERAGRRVTLYVDNEHLTLTEHEYGPGKRGARPHVHHDHSDAFLVLEGEVQITFESGPLRASAGTFVLIPPDVVHSFDNASDAAARFFNVHAPACGFGDYLRGRNPGFDQHDPSPDGGADPASIVVRTFDMGT
jgi:mannose-6-phosphate isomerase-like protein (cupin superfamily)